MSEMSLERAIAESMADEASGGVPDEIADQIISITSRSRPLPRWLALLREPSMRTQARVAVGVSARQLVLLGAILLTIAAVVIGAAAALLLRPQVPTIEWSGYRGDPGRNGVAIAGPVGNPTLKWQFKARGAVPLALSVAGGLVLVSSDDGVLHALAVGDGTERWAIHVKSPLGSPVVSGERVILVDGDGHLRAVRLGDGTPLWTGTDTLLQPSYLTVLGDHLYVGTQDGLLFAFDAATGKEAWHTIASPANLLVHAPAASGDVVVVTTGDGVVAALDAASGAVRWSVKLDIPGVPVLGNPAIVGDTAYVYGAGGTTTSRLTGLDLATGTERWRVNQQLSAVAVLDRTAYTGGPGVATARDATTGKELWRAGFTGNVFPPAVTRNVVYLMAVDERRVVALDRSTGGELWSFPIAGQNSCCIAVADGLVLIATNDGTISAIGGDGAALAPKPLSTPAPPTASLPSDSPRPSSSPTPATLFQPHLSWVVDRPTDAISPWGLAQAPDGRLWVADAISDRFSIFTADGKLVESWGTSGSGDGQFKLTRANGDPYGKVAFAKDGSFYVLDSGNRRVQRFDANRKFLRAWGSFGSDPGQFNDPIGIAVDGDGNVSVLDDVRAVIETYDPAGKVLRTIPAFPAAVGSRATANQLAIGPNGHLYVSTINPLEVIELDAAGSLVRIFGAPGDPGAFSEQPMGLAFDPQGRLYVTQGPNRGDAPGVLIFGPDGSYLGGFGPLGAGDADLGFPWGIVVDASGITVSDPGSVAGYRSAIRHFDPVSLP